MYYTNNELFDYTAFQQMEKWFADEIEMIMNGKKHLSYSALSKFLDSPLTFKTYKINKKFFPEEMDTKAMEEGKLFHMCLLEYEKFMDKHCYMDDSEIVEKLKKEGSKKPRATKDYKEWVGEFAEKNIGKTIIGIEDWNVYLAMSYAFRKNKESKPIFDALTQKEQKFECEINGFKFLGYYDGVGPNYNGGPLTMDAKKIASVVPSKLQWEIRDRKYQMQGGLYSLAYESKQHYIIFVDKATNVSVVKLTPDTLDQGINMLHGALESFEECAETDAWNQSKEFWHKGIIHI